MVVKQMASQTNKSSWPVRSTNQKSKQDPPRAKWTIHLTKVLADLLAEQVLNGNKKNNSFGKKAWKFMCEEFCQRTGLKWDKEQLKNRYCVLRRQYTAVKSLLDLNDFSWDESRRMVIATDEAWEEYIKVHPDAEVIRTNGCPIYRQLCIIFSNSKANGSHNFLNNPVKLDEESPLLPCPKAAGMSFDSEGPPMFVQEVSSSSTDDGENIPNEPSKSQSITEPSSGHRKRKHAVVSDVMAKAILEMAAASKLRAGLVVHGSDRFSISNCVKALDEMQGVEDHLYYAALDLFDKPNARETFMSLKVERRLVWLKGKCNASFGSSIE